MTSLDSRSIRVHRTGKGRPIVLLHCLGVDRRLWDIAAAGTSDALTLLSYDFPGHGETPVPGAGYGIEDLSDQLAAVLERERVVRAHVAGISLGGLVAQHFAATHPERVDRLVLIDTTPCYTDDLRRMWAVRAAEARQQGPSALLPGLLDIWFTPEFVAKDPPAVRYVRECFARTPGEGYALACEALAAADLRPLAPKIDAPTLVVCGEQDIGSFLDAARWLSATIKDARLAWLAPGRHASILEQPHAFRQALRAFLA